jgi:hypothetical protein
MPKACATAPLLCPWTACGLKALPQSSETKLSSTVTWPVSVSTSTSTAWGGEGIGRCHVAIDLVVVHHGLGVPAAADLDAFSAVAPDVLAHQISQRDAAPRLGTHADGTRVQLQGLGRNAECGGGLREQLVTRRARCNDGGIAGHDGHARRERTDAEGRGVGVRRDHVHMRQRDVQLVGYHLAEHGHGALAHVAFAAVDDHPAVLVDLHHHRGAVPVADGAVAADMHGGRHADAAPPCSGYLRALALGVPGRWPRCIARCIRAGRCCRSSSRAPRSRPRRWHCAGGSAPGPCRACRPACGCGCSSANCICVPPNPRNAPCGGVCV